MSSPFRILASFRIFNYTNNPAAAPDADPDGDNKHGFLEGLPLVWPTNRETKRLEHLLEYEAEMQMNRAPAKALAKVTLIDSFAKLPLRRVS